MVHLFNSQSLVHVFSSHDTYTLNSTVLVLADAQVPANRSKKRKFFVFGIIVLIIVALAAVVVSVCFAVGCFGEFLLFC